jgi:hypothetical protein
MNPLMERAGPIGDHIYEHAYGGGRQVAERPNHLGIIASVAVLLCFEGEILVVQKPYALHARITRHGEDYLAEHSRPVTFGRPNVHAKIDERHQISPTGGFEFFSFFETIDGAEDDVTRTMEDLIAMMARLEENHTSKLDTTH